MVVLLFQAIITILFTSSGIQAESTFHRELEPAGITVENYVFKTENDPLENIQELFVSCIFTME